jgi:hypothetical protein
MKHALLPLRLMDHIEVYTMIENCIGVTWHMVDQIPLSSGELCIFKVLSVFNFGFRTRMGSS